MDNGIASALSGIQSALKSHSVRAQNVANVNTRGYQAKEPVQTEGSDGQPEVTVRKRPESERANQDVKLDVSFQLHSEPEVRKQAERERSRQAEIQARSQSEPSATERASLDPLTKREVVSDGTVYAERDELEMRDPGDDKIKVGKLNVGEGPPSNVELEREMTGQILDEKALKANVKTIQARDQMLGEILDLKG